MNKILSEIDKCFFRPNTVGLSKAVRRNIRFSDVKIEHFQDKGSIYDEVGLILVRASKLFKLRSKLLN